MPRPSKRELLLDAATHVALQPGRLSLDRVASQAGVSKGGLLYHFPDRRSLLVAIVDRFVSEFETQVSHSDDREWARRYIDTTLSGSHLGPSGALLAVAAEDLSLLDPLRNRIQQWHKRAARYPGLSAVLLAADGVWYGRLFGLPVPDLDLQPDLERVFD